MHHVPSRGLSGTGVCLCECNTPGSLGRVPRPLSVLPDPWQLAGCGPEQGPGTFHRGFAFTKELMDLLRDFRRHWLQMFGTVRFVRFCVLVLSSIAPGTGPMLSHWVSGHRRTAVSEAEGSCPLCGNILSSCLWPRTWTMLHLGAAAVLGSTPLYLASGHGGPALYINN